MPTKVNKCHSSAIVRNAPLPPAVEGRARGVVKKEKPREIVKSGTIWRVCEVMVLGNNKRVKSYKKYIYSRNEEKSFSSRVKTDRHDYKGCSFALLILNRWLGDISRNRAFYDISVVSR